MFTNMQRIAIALLAVAFVQARVPAGKAVSDPRYDAVLDLYSTADHKLDGSLSFTWWTMIGVVNVRVDQPFNFPSKYRQVYANLYRFEDVMPGCVTVGNALVDSNGDEINIDDGEVLQLASNATNDPYLLKVNLLRGGDNSILDRVGVIYAMKEENDEYSAIACGRIRYAHSTDYFLRDMNRKRTLLPVPSEAETNAVQVPESASTDAQSTTPPQSATDKTIEQCASSTLVDPDNVTENGVISYERFAGNPMTIIFEFPKLSESTEGTLIAVLYHSENVAPGCVATGPAVAVRDAKLNATRPAIVYMGQFGPQNERQDYVYLLSCAVLSPMADCDIMGRVVILYLLPSGRPTVWHHFLEATNRYTPISCGPIKPEPLDEESGWSLSWPNLNRIDQLEDFTHYH